MSGRSSRIKYCAYGLLLMVAFVLENARGTSITLWGEGVTVLPFIVAAVALYEGPYAGGIFGFAAGILASIHSPVVEGLSSLYLGLFGILFGVVGMMWMRQVLLSAMLGGSVCLVFQGICRYIFYYGLVYRVPIAEGLQGMAAELLLSVPPGILSCVIIGAVCRHFREADE